MEMFENEQIENPKKEEKFKELWEAYHSGPVHEKFLNYAFKFRGEPNWSAIKNYSVEEMEFLLSLKKGETEIQKEKERKIIIDGKTKDFQKVKKSLQKSRWKKFNEDLSNKHRLALDMEYEENFKQR